MENLTFVDDDILKYLSDNEKLSLEELVDLATYRMMHEDDPLFDEDRPTYEIGEDDRVEEEEDKEQTNLFEEGEEEEEGREEDFIKEVFNSGRLDVLFSLVRSLVLSMEYVAGFVQRPVIETEELYELWLSKPGRIDLKA